MIGREKVTIARAVVVVLAVLVLAAKGSHSGLAISSHPSSQATMAEETEAAPAPPFLKGKLWRFWPEIQDAAHRAGVDPMAWAAIVSLETSGNPLAIGQAGELGLSQYQPVIAEKMGAHCIERWSSPTVNLRCGARWFELVRRPFVPHGPGRADLLGMIAYHSGMLVYASEAALSRGDDPCDFTDRSYCVMWRDRVESGSSSEARNGIAERGAGAIHPGSDRAAARPGGSGSRSH